MIQLTDFSIGYHDRQLMQDVSAVFRRGELTALIGRNGTGKSTLLRAIAGLNSNYSGNISLDGHDLRELHAGQLARTLAFVSTHRTRIPAMRCRDVVALGRAPYTNWIGRMQPEDEKYVMNALNAVGMEAYAGRTLDTMSDGECQRVMVARAIAQDTPIILLDEPTSFLDMPARYELVELLHTLVDKQHKCIIFSTHELDIATHIAQSVALIDPPFLIQRPADKFLSEGHLSRLFHIPILAASEKFH